ncbi:MAG TPA: hypothetical protein VM943_01490, partial [Pyrinomonadaceae bacterium]|nr:hypothetical protein [Pyrinomonadaceae bacterium]
MVTGSRRNLAARGVSMSRLGRSSANKEKPRELCYIPTPLQFESIVPRNSSDMSGHSKWHTIKHKKGALDAKRG